MKKKNNELFEEVATESIAEARNVFTYEEIGLSGNLVGISINLCKSIQKELFINDTS